MTEQQTTIRRGRGRPSKSPIEREPQRESNKFKMRSNPNWETVDPFAEDTPDQLRIMPSLIPEGLSFQWVTESIYGKPMPERLAMFERKGWTVVHNDDFDGQLDGLYNKRGSTEPVRKDGMVLVARPVEMTIKARARDKQQALEKVRIKEQALFGGELLSEKGVTLDATHRSAVGFNRINKSVERLTIPDD
jgi:hypothetical protein